MDNRDFAHIGVHNYITEIDEERMTVTLEVNGKELTVSFKYEVCGSCRGAGSYVDPNIDRNGISREIFDQDEEFHNDYMSGVYNVRCNSCSGKRVYPILKNTPKELNDALDDDYDFEQISQAERRMGC